jgi:hypothetical protein
MPASAKVFISHSHEEKELALAWKELFDNVGNGAVEVWLSSDSSASGGMALGEEWRNTIYEKLAGATHMLAIVTPQSATRPWILWECGVATGINKERKLVPIAHSMPLSDLPSPLQSYQAYDGDDRASVQQVCERMLTGAGFKPNPKFWTQQLELFEDRVKTSRPPRPLSPSLLELWWQRFGRLIDGSRGSELRHLVDQFYLAVGERTAVDSRIHDRLSEALLAAKVPELALCEVDFALKFSPNDTVLLHRKGLILLELGNLHDVEQLLKEVYARVPQVKNWPELAGLEGRMYRERARLQEGDAKLYRQAAAAYRRAFDFDVSQHYPGGQAVAMAVQAGDEAMVDELLPKVIAACQQAAAGAQASYWEDFTLAEMYLLKKDLDAAVGSYERGLARRPAPSPRDRDSTLKGARRTAAKRSLDAARIETLFAKEQ